MDMTLRIGVTQAKPLEEYNIIGAELSQSLDGSMSLTLETAARLRDPYIIPPFQRCTLRVDDEVRFTGWLDEAPRSSSGTEDRVTYKLSGPMRWFDRIMFNQARGGLVFVGGTPSANQVAVQTWRQAAEAIISSGLSTQINATPSLFYPDWEIPARPRSDITCAEAWKTLMSFAPMAFVQWVWNSNEFSKPFMFVNEITDEPFVFFDLKNMELIEASINPRYDLLVSEVKVNYMRDNVITATQISNLTNTDASNLAANRSVSYTFDTSSVLNVPTAGLANAILRHRGRLHVDGSATRNGIDWNDVCGQTWGFRGSHFASLEGLRTILHSMKRDLFREITQMEFGVPSDFSIYEKYNRSDFDRGNVAPISIPSYTGNVSNVPYTPIGGSSNGGSFEFPSGSDLSFSGTAGLQATSGISTVRVDGSGISANCTTGFSTRIECGIITISGPAGSVSFDGDELNGKSLSFREIENCDGQKAMVLMSDWY